MKTIYRGQRNPDIQKNIKKEKHIKGRRKEYLKNKVIDLAHLSWKVFWQKQSFVVFLYDLLGIALTVALLVGGALLAKWTYLGFTPTAKLAFETAQAINVDPNQATALKEQISTIKWGLYRWITGMVVTIAAIIVIPTAIFSASSFFSASKLAESLKARQVKVSRKEIFGAGELGTCIGILFLCISLLTAIVLQPPVNAIVFLVFFFIFLLWWLTALYAFIITKRVWRSLAFFWKRRCKDILVLCSIGLLMLGLFLSGNVILSLAKLVSLKAYAFLLVVWIVVNFILIKSIIFSYLQLFAFSPGEDRADYSVKRAA